MKTPLKGRTLYVIFQGDTPVEVTAYAPRAANRAQEWSVPGKTCVVAGVTVNYVWGESVDEHQAAHEAECGLGDDCPKKAPERVDAGASEQLAFDFSDEEPTVRCYCTPECLCPPCP